MKIFWTVSIKPVLTIVIGAADVAVVNGILMTGNFETVIGFDVVIIVIFVGCDGGCREGGVVLITGSILTHFPPVDAVFAYDCSLTQLVICCCEIFVWFMGDTVLGKGFGNISGLWFDIDGIKGIIFADGGGDG